METDIDLLAVYLSVVGIVMVIVALGAFVSQPSAWTFLSAVVVGSIGVYTSASFADEAAKGVKNEK